MPKIAEWCVIWSSGAKRTTAIKWNCETSMKARCQEERGKEDSKRKKYDKIRVNPRFGWEINSASVFFVQNIQWCDMENDNERCDYGDDVVNGIQGSFQPKCYTNRCGFALSLYSYTFLPSALIHFQSLRSYVWASLSGVVMGLTPFDVMKKEFKCSSPSFQRNCIHFVKYIVELTWICENGVVAIMIGKSEPWAQRELFHFWNNRVIAYGALVLECELFHCTLSAQRLLICCDGWENEHRQQNEAVEKKWINLRYNCNVNG